MRFFQRNVKVFPLKSLTLNIFTISVGGHTAPRRRRNLYAVNVASLFLSRLALQSYVKLRVRPEEKEPEEHCHL